MIFTKHTPRPIFDAAPQRILIIKPSAIGDVVHALPILNLLRRRWPRAHISWLVIPGCAGLLEGHPHLDEVILFDRKLFARSWKSFRVAKQFVQFARELRQRKFDLVIDLQGLFRSGVLALITGAPVRVGSSDAREFGWVFCNYLAPIDPTPQHAIDRYLAVAEFVGLGRSPVEFVFATDDADREYIASLIPVGRRFAVLFPGTNWSTKRWPTARFAALVEPFREQFGLECVLAGGTDAAELARAISGAIDLTNRTSLRQLVALLERADLVIAPDTGPMHIASALNRPLVTMYGPTSPIQTGPYARPQTVVQLDIPCSPCFSRKCSHHSCLVQLQIDPVLRLAAEQIFSSPV